jgi:UDP-N-acetylenolpyruvoylglucosamine reductase
MKTTHLKARYSTDGLREQAEAIEVTQEMRDIAEQVKEKIMERLLAQLSTKNPRPFRTRSAGCVFIDPQLLNISHHFF